MGIRPDDVQKIFSDYNQVDTRTNRKVEGTGLGLAITRRLVDMMDGTITVESEYGKGTAFHVRLRQAIASDVPIGEEIAGNLMNMRYTLSRRAGKTKHGRVNLSYAHVLVVDDVVTNLDVAKGMMKPYKVNIDCALSGQEAIDMIRKGEPKYSAIFMDHMMPGMDGIEAARLIREDIGTEYARKIPIIALTANAIVGNSEMFLNKGFQDFVSKPIDMMKLDAVLRTWVRNRELEKQLAPAGEEAALSGGGSPDSENIASPLAGIRIEGIDKGQALESFDGDEDIFIDVMRSYATNTRPFLITLKEYLQTGNMEDYAIVVHGIKGASYGVFAREVGDAARVLELAAKAGNLDAVRAGHGAFEKTVETLIAVIDEVLVKVEARSNTN
jgi:CheY-like chemotaxis protein